MRAQVVEDPARPMKRIYDAAVSTAHIQGGGDRPELDSFHTFRTMLNRTKASLRPGIPRIDGPWAETWLNEQFLLYTDNNWGISIFGTNENLKALQKCRELSMDATFRCCPAPYTQFFTIMSKYREWVIPLAMVLMEGRQTGDYCQVLTVLAREIRRVTGHRWRPRKVIDASMRL